MNTRLNKFPATKAPSCRSRTFTHGVKGHATRLGKILVPIDFSAGSKKACQYATQLARRYGAAIRLVHVVAPIVFDADYGYGTVIRQTPNQEAIKRAKIKLERLGAKMVGAPRLADCTVRSGIAFFEITEAARMAKTDLIIIGTHGDTGFAKPDTGSTAEKVVRHAPCPVLVVRRKEHEFSL